MRPEEIRLRFVARLNPSKSEVSHLAPDTEVAFLPMEAVGETGSLDLTATRPLAGVQNGFTYFRNNDVIVAKITPCFENGKGALARGLPGAFGFGTTELHVLRPGPKLDPRYLYYLTASHQFRFAGQGSMYGAGGQKRVPEDFIRDFPVPTLSCERQSTIAAFLDRKTAAIDELIRKKKRLIELHQEKRQAVITQAVTKGLDPNVPMKDSGVDWLGEIPARWEVCRVKHLMARIVDCPHSTPDYAVDGDFPAVRTADVDWGRLLLEQAFRVREPVYRERIARMEPAEGDILYSREGERFGMAALVPPAVKLCLAQRMMIFRPLASVSARYCMWLLNSQAVYQQVKQDTVGATSPRINIPTIANALVVRPPRIEQERIAQFIERTREHIDIVTTTIGLHVDRLKEYRQAIISAAVTGQLDLSKEVA